MKRLVCLICAVLPWMACAGQRQGSHQSARAGRVVRSSGDTVSPGQAALSAAQRAVARAQRAEAEGSTGSACDGWPLWERFVARFVQRDGRVVDLTADGRSTSEGQAYGLFFALVADDRPRFERILRWTADNLAAADLEGNLPAWLWGRKEDGSYGVLDPNAASDADLWLAYALVEAGRIWGVSEYQTLGLALARRVLREEVRKVPGLGLALLPGPEGFVGDQGAVRLNPSYLVLPILRRFAAIDPTPKRWHALIDSSVRVLRKSAPEGLAPDWVKFLPGRGFVDDPEHGPFGSYDAIRVYLWSGAVPEGEPHRAQLSRSASRFAELIARTGRVPERIDVRSAEISEQEGPPGFVAVALAAAHGRDPALAKRLAERLERARHHGLYGEPATYYDQMLALFALGQVQAWYAFDADGKLEMPWKVRPCGH